MLIVQFLQLTFNAAVKHQELKDCALGNALSKTIEGSVWDQRETVKRRG